MENHIETVEKYTEQVIITTHDGIFHADEVLAIAMIKFFLPIGTNFVINRTRDKNWLELSTLPNKVWAVDVGGKYNPESLNFDHHQDKTFPASNLLVLEHLISQGLIKGQHVNALMKLNKGISDFDVNRNEIIQKFAAFKGENDTPVTSISEILSGFNRDPSDPEEQNRAFDYAVQVAMTILMNTCFMADEVFAAINAWNKKIFIGDRVCMTTKYVPNWQNLAKVTDGEIQFYVCANPTQKGNWNVTSVDSEKYPMPTEEEIHAIIGAGNVEFVHNKRFFCVLKSFDAAQRLVTNSKWPVVK